MQRRLTIILLGLYLFSFSEFSQLLKIPVLFQHFIEHRQFNPSITFWDFIQEHYNGKFEVDEDYERDNQLPFRTSDYVAYSITISEAPEGIRINRTEIPVVTDHIIVNDENHLFGLIADIWQPPRRI